MSAFQKSATKPHTYTIMTPESLGAEYTSGTWNSARVRPGKSSAKESTTQVRFSALLAWMSSKVKFCLYCWFQITSDTYQANRKGITSPPSSCFFDQSSMVTTSLWMKRQIIWLTVTQEWCCRAHPMGLRGVFISKGDVRGHLTFLGTKDRNSREVSCSLNRNRVFFFFVTVRVYSIRHGEKKLYCCKVHTFDISPDNLKCDLHLIVF